MSKLSKDLIELEFKSKGADNVTVDLDKITKGVKEIELEAKAAKGAIAMFKDENKSLSELIKREEKTIKALSKELKELASNGDTSSKKVKALAEAQENARIRSLGYKNQIVQNNEAIKQAGYLNEYEIRNLNLKDMTMNQLSKRADYLRGKLNNIVKEKDLTTWNKYNDQLIEVEKQQKKVAAGGEQVKSRFDSIGNTIKKVLPLMVAYAALRVFQNIISGAIDWIKKAPEVAAKAEGVSRAFNKLNNSGLLSTLRKETKGLVNDLVLMQSSVRADRFGIPINNLAKYLKFAQQRAQETGQAVDYLSESIINGIGRKSPLILDNLGISAARLKAEMKSGLDFAQATTKIVEEELQKQGDLSLTSADKATQAAVKWENAQLKVGNRLKWLSDKWNEFSGSVADGVGRIAGDSKTGVEAFDDQVKKVAELEVSATNMAKRYTELSKKANLSKEEHIELNKVMNSLSNTVPGIVDKFDGYGRILSINTNKVYEYIEAERARLWLINKEGIETYTKLANNAQKELNIYKERYEWLKEGKERLINLYGEEYYTNQLKAAEKYISEYGNILKGANAQLDYLTGKSMADQVKSHTEIINAQNKFNAMTDIQLKNWIDSHKNATDSIAVDAQGFVTKIKDTGVVVKNYFAEIKKDIDEIGKQNPFAVSGLSWLQPKPDETKKETTVELSDEKQLELAKQIYSQRVGFETPPKEEKESKILARQKEELKARLENLETAHKYELMAIKADAEKKGLAEDESQKQVLESEAKYYNDRIGIYDQFVKDFKVTNEKFQEDIKGGKADAKDKLVDISPQVDKNRLDEVSRLRDEALRKLEEQENQQKLILEKRNLDAEQYDYELQVLEMHFSEQRLDINRQYGKDVEALELQNGRTKTEAVRTANAAILAEETELIKNRNAVQRTAQEASFSLRSQYGVTTRDEEFARDQKMLQAALTTNVVDYETYQKLLTQLDKEYEDKRLQIKDQYGLASVKDLYNAELDNLRIQHEQGILSEKEYEEAKFRLKMEYAAKWVDKQKPWLERASNMVSALMAAETAQLDAEYDVRIAAAEGNKEETERLETEKAQKKLDIEKKYADVQFAVKASEIIASTAVAIMTGYAQLGPVMGTIAAVMLGVTGAAQLAAANAEREKVKNMTLGGSGSSAGSRGVIVAGREKGGYLDVTRSQDGKHFNALYDPDRRGFVNGPTVIVGEDGQEWVATNKATKNPTIAPIIGLIDEAERNGTVESLDLNRALNSRRLAGFAEGGSLNNRPAGSPAPASTVITRNEDLDREMIALLKYLKENGVFANIGVTELEAQKAYKQQIDNMFTLKDN